MPAEYAKLRSLLLQEEIDKIDRLTQEIRDLEKNQQKGILVEKLSKIITDILSKSLQENQQKLYASLQPIISKGVADELYRSKDLQKILFPIITSAIQEQVHEQKESIVDALYPIMGNMISKYVTTAFSDMMHQINSTLQSSLSFARIKRKFKSKFYGVSEAQLLLQETDFVDIETIFLIHKESGLLIVDLHKEENQKIDEVEMVASMLSAIRSFVNDWISSDQEMSEIREIEYSNSSISIESAGSCYLAVVTNNHADMKDKLSKVLSRIVSKYSRSLSEFDGDTSQLNITNIKEILSTLFDNAKDTSKDKFPLLGVVFLVLFLMIPLGWYSYSYYQSYKIEQNEQKIESILKENRIKIYDLDIDTTLEGEVILDGMVLYRDDREKIDVVLRGYTYSNQVNSIDKNFNKNYKIVLMKQIVNSTNRDYNATIAYKHYYDKIRFTGLLIDKKAREIFIEKMKAILDSETLFFDIEVFPEAIQKIVELTNREYQATIKYHQDENKIRFTGLIINEKARRAFIHKIETVLDAQRVINEIEVLPLLDKNIYFSQGSSKIPKEYNMALDRLSSVMIDNECYYVKISGYTDVKGTDTFNKMLSANRAMRIKQALIDRGVKEEMIIIKAIAKPPKELEKREGKNSEFLSRCVMFNWEIKDGE